MSRPSRPAPARQRQLTSELAALQNFLRRAQGDTSFAGIAARATQPNRPVHEDTLRRALDGRLPAARTVAAFARGTGADETTAEQLRKAARRASRPPAPSYKPGRLRTPDGLRGALNRLKGEAGMSLNDLVEAAGGRLARSTLHSYLTTDRLPDEEWLIAFAAACGADQDVADALTAARRRILTGPRPPAVYPCDIADRADELRQDAEATRPWQPAEPELDANDQQLRDEEEAAPQRHAAWVDSLTDDELAILQQQTTTTDDQDLLTRLRAHLPHPGPDTNPNTKHT